MVVVSVSHGSPFSCIGRCGRGYPKAILLRTESQQITPFQATEMSLPLKKKSLIPTLWHLMMYSSRRERGVELKGAVFEPSHGVCYFPALLLS